MPSDGSVLRSADLIGKPAYDLAGAYLGRVAELTVVPDSDGYHRLSEVVVTPRIWGRLLGYERAEQTGPWVLLVLARWLVHRHLRRVPWSEVRLGNPGHDRPA